MKKVKKLVVFEYNVYAMSLYQEVNNFKEHWSFVGLPLAENNKLPGNSSFHRYLADSKIQKINIKYNLLFNFLLSWFYVKPLDYLNLNESQTWDHDSKTKEVIYRQSSVKTSYKRD